MKQNLRLFGSFAAPAILLAMSAPAWAAGVDAGSLITNTAQASYDDGSGTQTLTSNEVVLKVDELLDVTVVSLDPGSVAATPGEAVLAFEITNTGNGPEAFSLTADGAVAGNDFEPTIDGYAVDTNLNGIYDPGIDEVLGADGLTPVIDADDTLTVFVLVTVPDTVSDTDEAQVELTAEAATGFGTPGTTYDGQGENGSDAVVGLTGADDTASGTLVAGISTVRLVKTAEVVDPFGGSAIVPGSVVTYTLTATVTGSSSISNFVVTDAYPTDTTYRASSMTLNSGALTDASGDDEGRADATGITVDLGTVPGDSTNIITFAVTVDQ